MSSDPFSDVLRLTEAKSVMSGGFSAGGAWGLRIPRPGQIVFSAIAKRACWLRLDNQKKPVRLEEGDVGLLSGDTAVSGGAARTPAVAGPADT